MKILNDCIARIIPICNLELKRMKRYYEYYDRSYTIYIHLYVNLSLLFFHACFISLRSHFNFSILRSFNSMFLPYILIHMYFLLFFFVLIWSMMRTTTAACMTYDSISFASKYVLVSAHLFFLFSRLSFFIDSK